VTLKEDRIVGLEWGSADNNNVSGNDMTRKLSQSRTAARVPLILLGAVLACALLLTTASAALAQSASPICDEYSLPQCGAHHGGPSGPHHQGGTSSGTGGQSSSTGQDAAAGAGAIAGGGGSGRGGDGGGASSGGSPGSTVPFAGYPITSLIWLLLTLLAAGLVLRLGIAGVKRYQRTRALG
jgi:hypothetical protein